MKKFKNYLDSLSRANHLGEGFDIEWLFYCGMLFSSREKWWDDFKFRNTLHEGIDICWYRTCDRENFLSLDTSTLVLSMTSSILVNVCDDFLGKTLVFEDGASQHAEHRILYTYAHIDPLPGLETGQKVQQGQPIATICDTIKNPLLPPHLHFSCFEVSWAIPDDALNWNLFCDANQVNMIHPVFL